MQQPDNKLGNSLLTILAAAAELMMTFRGTALLDCTALSSQSSVLGNVRTATTHHLTVIQLYMLTTTTGSC